MWILLLVLVAIVILAAREAFLYYVWLEELQRARQRFHADLHRKSSAGSDVRGQA